MTDEGRGSLALSRARKILVVGARGGVGKSTIASQLAFGLAAAGKRVGVLDADVGGPSAPMMLGLASGKIRLLREGWAPVTSPDGALACVSTGNMQADDADGAAIVWRGPRKNGLIKQFLRETSWGGERGELDYLIVDTPPGVSEEMLSAVQLLHGTGGIDGAVLVTSSQPSVVADTRRHAGVCRKLNVPLLGVVENMSSMRIPLAEMLSMLEVDGHPEATRVLVDAAKSAGIDSAVVGLPLFSAAGTPSAARAMAEALATPFLGAVPFDPKLHEAAQSGARLLDASPRSPAAVASDAVVQGGALSRAPLPLPSLSKTLSRFSNLTDPFSLRWDTRAALLTAIDAAGTNKAPAAVE